MNQVTYSIPTKFLFNTGIVSVGGTQIAASEGGVTVEFDTPIRNVPFDGQAAPNEGLDRFERESIRIRGKFKAMSETFLTRLFPGATSDGSTPVNTITPLKAHTFFTVGTHYLATVKFVGDRNDGVTAGFTIPKALITTRELATAPNTEGLWDITIESRLDNAATDLRAAPFTAFVDNT